MKKLPLFMLLITTMTAAAFASGDLTPPVAKQVPRTLTIHGDERVDEYGWLRDKKSPEVIAYLEAENAYAAAVMKPTEELQKQLYSEMLGRIKQTDVQVPYRKGSYLYYTRTVEGQQYPILSRRKGEDAAEEILLDVNELAAGKKYMSVDSFEVSDDENLLAYTIDDTGYRQYKLFVKDLRTGKVSPLISGRVDAVEWAKDNKTLFYVTENDAKRTDKLFRHVYGSSEHTQLLEEKDELFELWIDRSRSGDFIFVTSESKTTAETRLIDAGKPQDAPVMVVPRKTDLKYYLEHRGDRFYILTNDAGINFRVVTAPVNDFAQAKWTELVPYRKGVKIDALDVFANHMVLRLKEGGLIQLETYDLRDEKHTAHRVTFPEAAYALLPSTNAEFDTNAFRYAYQSFITPTSVYEYDLDKRTAKLLKRTEVLGGYDPAKYKVERFFVTVRDGAKVPVSIVYRKDIQPKKNNPLYLYAYGSYGSSQQAGFNSNRFSLIDRGVIYAIAHIRGGGEMGKEWHEQGRMLTKKNTFNDFVDVAESLSKEGYTSKEKLAISGGSAGGLLVGAVLNMRPDLFKAAVAYVPFVDVINTMLDPTVPLTTQEYIEWGNPNEREAYLYMKSYDPYGNVAKKAYPALLVRASLNDSQVGYWEAAKWVARLRALKTDKNELLFRVNMGAGHGGASGRYDKLHDDAHDYAWVLKQLGVVGAPIAD